MLVEKDKIQWHQYFINFATPSQTSMFEGSYGSILTQFLCLKSSNEFIPSCVQVAPISVRGNVYATKLRTHCPRGNAYATICVQFAPVNLGKQYAF